LINPAEPFPEASDLSDGGSRDSSEFAGSESEESVDTEAEDVIRPFVYRPPVGKAEDLLGNHPRRRRTDITSPRGN